jgi:muramoyltetrapeptide carboxypeptidase
MICHLKRQGVFSKIKGLILGEFSELLDTERPYGFTLDDIIAEHVPHDLPIIKNAPFGHGNRLITLLIGLD